MSKPQYLPLLCTLLLLSCTERKAASDQSEQAPNVLLILVDDLGYHDLGVTGSTFYETPNIDRLAANSVRFTQAYAGSRVCSPSRATLMLGQYTPTHGITDWIGARSGEEWRKNGRYTSHLPPDYVRELPQQATTLAEALGQGGYRTFFAGKWHLGGEGSMPTDHGFDINVGGNHQGSPPGGFFDPYDNPQLPNRRAGENLSLRLADETRDFIVSAHGGGPFFAMLSFYAVHAPLQTTRERWRHFRDKAVEGGTADRAFEMERRLPIRTVQDNPVYAGLVSQMDDAVGVVLDALDSLSIADNTIVVFTADNGGVASGDAYATSNLPLRGGKGYQWEGGIREPLFIRAPRLSAREVDVPVTGADIFPTLLSLTGVEANVNQSFDGQNISPAIETDTFPERSLIWHYPHYGNQGGDPSSIIRRGDWKLIHYWENGREELYQIGRGTQEQTDVASSHPGLVTDLSGELMTFLEERGARYPTADPDYSPEDFARKERFYRDTLLPRLEGERVEMFGEGWVPNGDWWGSGGE